MTSTRLVDSFSDTDTVLSDPPTDLDDMASGQDIDRMSLSGRGRSLERRSISRSYRSDDSMTDAFGIDDDCNWYPQKKPRLSRHVRSKFEGVPTEILNKIVSFLPDDRDLFSLMCACKTFAQAFNSSQSAIWRQRFESIFDWPFIDHATDFASAYQLRKFVLKHFVEFTDPDDERLLIQLEVLRDMVLEAYNQPPQYLPRRSTSLNLAALTSDNSPWIQVFLSCPFFPSPYERYGQRFPAFDALSVCLSHLLLSPASRLAYTVKSSRTNYDLAIVYNWDTPLSLLYRKLERQNEKVTQVMSKVRIKRYGGRLHRRSHTGNPTYELDTYTLLHIRNFWHRHLIQTVKGFGSTDITENTYAKMAKELMRYGITPTQWDRPLTEGSLLEIPTEWYGHYSTLGSNWPRKRQELEEVQSLAEDWQEVDPLKLDFAISRDNDVDGFWSPIFKNIPAFQKAIPESTQCVFIRGLAPFVQLSSSDSRRGLDSASRPDLASQATLTLPTAPRLPKYHPYLALRLRGVIHSIPQPQANDKVKTDHSIPGFNHIIMILYKPTKRYLIQVLEHAEEEYGDTFTTQIVQNSTGSTLDPAEIDARLDQYLRSKLVSNPLWRDGSKLDKDAIEEMEEKFRLSEYLDWTDIDYAYAYNGAIIPGGKIMMGRFYRISMLGDGDGLEWSDSLGALDEDGDAAAADGGAYGDPMDLDEVGGGDGQGQNEAGNPNSASEMTRDATSRHKKRERGPFIFWCREQKRQQETRAHTAKSEG
ncbi:uncharacterized protein Z520_10318 [Fonsecaea multimorphosa CBS 102226]|uniref:F-box domain-containing protein n=1 Tax=Fonsecaea multimorphosa CBS 102226 TaxID=1442371 RepID=A0A0D2IA00_9EURO|nr:uncharacterized protein Z520_10318 [Fonsecaea multimorphosa CBS 102226]KIX93981.1 hypothetical protein Z520_10318 [Fonsecaea multimorphosa CBS 102226]OAL19328.1 hypothetical protein AYO22_09872 [Fonsecaea multimorphosa]